MLRRSTAALLVAALALLLPSLAGAGPVGPRLTFFEAEVPRNPADSELEPEANMIARFAGADPQGDGRRTLPVPGSLRVQPSVVSWDADGGEFAFRAKKPGPGPVQVYLARADGSGTRRIPAATGTISAVLSPDGRWLAFTRRKEKHPKIEPKDPIGFIEELTHGFNGSTTWIVPTAGGRPRRLTPWDNGRFSRPSSFSPDGATLLVTVERIGAKQEVDAIDLATGESRTVEVEASEAAYSPDGSQIAFISYRDHESVPGFDDPEGTSELYVASADGSGARRITHTPRMQETAPSWDPSGERFAYLRSPGGMLGFLFGKVAEVNADGSCQMVIPTPRPRHQGDELFFGEPTWQPGPGRGAGPISC